MHFSNSGLESKWLDKYVENITRDEDNSENAILYKVKVNGVDVEPLYDTSTSISVMSKWFLDRFPSSQTNKL